MKSTEHFMFAGWDTVELARRFGTPLYLLSEEKVSEKCRLVREGFLEKYPDTRALYASKAFLTLAMCRIIEREGLGLDVASGGELYIAHKAGFPLEKIYFHGNNKTPWEIEMALDLGVGTIVVDSEAEFELLEGFATRLGVTQSILLRVSPGIDVKTHKYISTGHPGSKFGFHISGEQLSRVEKRAVNSANIELRGYHFHLGSQLYETESYVMAVKVMLGRISELQDKTGHITEELNIGGGFGVPENSSDDDVTLTDFTDPIMAKIIEECQSRGTAVPVVTIEPGRWLVSEAGITLYTVGAIKDIPGLIKYVAVDGGMTDNPRPALYGAHYQALVAERPNVQEMEKVTIVGKCCESGDVLVRDACLPSVKPGDIIAVLNTGAYNYSMSSNYNANPRPAVVLLRENSADVIVERQTYEDLLRGQVIPQGISI